ncbi:hypothetical protein [Actibacterium lipolyticum]|uniref:Secreted protein n=1 Tax=Actibacterium lipolyticum TaxID=1524263 RepID=A0A238KQ22_9RHOB|nr:hypothetical protein [Actibacterium lipolyticum]SMX44731.1 hypothetical protein COL8621_02619 [Actibacterium lipolyticum]
MKLRTLALAAALAGSVAPAFADTAATGETLVIPSTQSLPAFALSALPVAAGALLVVVAATTGGSSTGSTTATLDVSF